jgi:hypothetical protein
MPDTMIERVGERLRAECLEVFGSTWSNDVAWRFARAAIEALREPTEAMEVAGDKASYDYLPRHIAVTAYKAMVEAALKEQEGEKR